MSFTTETKMNNEKLNKQQTEILPQDAEISLKMPEAPTPIDQEVDLGETVTGKKDKDGVFISAFKKENVVGSFLESQMWKKAMNSVTQVDPEYNYMEELNKPENSKYREFKKYAEDTVNKFQFEIFKQRVDAELQRNRTLKKAGIKGIIAMIGATAIDPIAMAMPLALPIKAVGVGLKAIVKYAGKVALKEASATAVQEVGLQATQVTRTAEETVMNVVAVGMLGGILGGAMGTLAKPNRDAITKNIKNRLIGKKQSLNLASTINDNPELKHFIGKAGVEKELNLSVSKSLKKVFKATKVKHIPEWLRTDLNNKFADVDTMTRDQILDALGGLKLKADGKKYARWTNNFIDKIVKEIPENKPISEIRHYLGFTKDTLNHIEGLITPKAEIRQMIMTNLGGVETKTSERVMKSLQSYFTIKKPEVVTRNTVNNIISKVKKNLAKDKTLSITKQEEIVKNLDTELHTILIDDRVQKTLNRIVDRRNAYNTIDPSKTIESLIKEDQLKKLEGVEGINKYVLKTLGLNNPVVKGLTSDSTMIRQFTNDVLEHNFRTGKVLKGQASDTSVETLMRLDSAKTFKMNKEATAIYSEYLGAKGLVDRSIKSVFKKGKMSREQFSGEVAKAMNNGDTHVNKYVEKTAKLYRKEIDTTWKKLEELYGFKFKSNVNSQSYFMQIWNRELVSQERPEVLKMFANLFEDKNRKPQQFKSIVDLPQEIVESANNAINSILGVGDGRIQFESVLRSSIGSGSFTKERILDFDPNVLSRYLVQDAGYSVPRFLHQANTMIRLKEWLQGKGFENLSQFKKALRDENILKQSITTDPKAKLKLDKSLDNDLKYVDDMISILTDTYSKLPLTNPKIATSLRTLRKYNLVTKLGGVMISSLPDIAMQMFTHGLPTLFKHNIIPTIRSLKTMKVAKNELSDFVLGLDYMQDEILKRLTHTGEFTGRNVGKIEKVGDAIVTGFGHLTGINAWNSMWRRVSAVTSSARTLRQVGKLLTGETISKRENLRLLDLGLDKNMQSRIAEQFQKYGKIENGTYIGNYIKWDDLQAREMLMASVERETDLTVIAPSKGDIPIWANSEIGKVIFQFRSFSSAASNRILLRSMQNMKDANVIYGLASLIFLGSMVSVLKDKISGKEHKERTTTEAILDGISRSGVTGLFGDLTFALNPYGTPSRFAGLTAMNTILGVSTSTVMDMFQVANDTLDDFNVSPEGMKNIKELIPYNNLFYLKQGFDKVFNTK